MEKKNKYSPGLEADRRLLVFKTWEDYLDSLVEVAEIRHLRSLKRARIIAALGYRTSGDVLTEKQFYKRRAVIQELMHPTLKPYVLVSEREHCDDLFMRELAQRERANRVGILQSIIFIRIFTSRGFEVSGYVDYAARLLSEDWTELFRGERRLRPRSTDLCYYHWRHGSVFSNATNNYKPFVDPDRGLLFENVHDHLIICPDPYSEPGQNSTRLTVLSPYYEQLEILDHVARKKT